MPTLVACVFGGLVLVVAVGLQAPARSVGLRWRPGPGSERLLPFVMEPLGGLGLEIGGSGQPIHWLSRVGWILAAIVGLGLLARVVHWIVRIIQPAPATTVTGAGADSAVAGEPDAQIVQSGLAAALQVLASERDPGNAIVRAWQGLQDAAAAAGLDRRPAETTSEFTARILYRSRRSAEPIDVLLSLYQRVRFRDHFPDVGDIAAARHSLAALVELWQTDLPERRPTTRAR